MNWCNPQDYEFTDGLTSDQWAWEFLRRNPVYRQEWRIFHTTWKQLETAYGKPGHRDMAAWRQDPRAWVSAEECQESDCRVDDEKVLIECAMGAHWGFYKFPPDPADDDPVGHGRLRWRELTLEPTKFSNDQERLEMTIESLVLGFDLSLPLRDQLVSAKRLLQIEQRRRVREGIVRAPRISAHRDRLCRLLRLLDALETGRFEDFEAIARDLAVHVKAKAAAG